MENILRFLAYKIDGPIYVIVVILAIIFLFACIGYLAEKKMKATTKEKQYIEVNNNTRPVQEINNMVVNEVIKDIPIKPVDHPIINEKKEEQPVAIIPDIIKDPVLNSPTPPINPVTNIENIPKQMPNKELIPKAAIKIEQEEKILPLNTPDNSLKVNVETNNLVEKPITVPSPLKEESTVIQNPSNIIPQEKVLIEEPSINISLNNESSLKKEEPLSKEEILSSTNIIETL